MKRIFESVLYNLAICLIIALGGFVLVGPAAVVVAGILFIAGLIPQTKRVQGTLNNEVVKIVFTRDLQSKLYPDNSFYKLAQVDAGVANDAESVEIPQDEDGDAQSVVNPSKFPLESYAEEDKKKTYAVDLLATKPQIVTDLNQAVTTYDKRAAKIKKHSNTLNTLIADRIAYAWAPSKADFIRQTTGTDVRATRMKGATGNRKRVTKADMLYIMSMFNDLDIPLEGRSALFPAYMYEDLLTIADFIDADKLGKMGAIPKGVVGQLLGFNIYVRSRTPIYTEAATPVKKPLGAVAATTDNSSSLFWHPDFVRYAEGNVKLYLNPDQGQYLGGTLNASVRSGGTTSRLSEIGVAALVEDNA